MLLKESETFHSLSFDMEVACYFKSADVAVVYRHIEFWIRNNQKKNKNYIDGRTWMYETAKEISLHLGYLSEDSVQRILLRLVKEGFLIKEFNAPNKNNRTAWYAIPEKSKLNKCLPFRSSAECQTAELRNVVNTDKHEDKQQQTNESGLDAQVTSNLAIAAAASYLKIYKCLMNLQVPTVKLNDKIRITNTYDEETVINALARINEPGFIPEDTYLKSLNAALKGKWKPSLGKKNKEKLEKNIKENKDNVLEMKHLGFNYKFAKENKVEFDTGDVLDLTTDFKDFEKQLSSIQSNALKQNKRGGLKK